jgi:glycerol dehydrogenase
LILASSSSHNKILVSYREALHARGIRIEPFSGECCEKELIRLADILRREGIDVIAGMGGGKTIDTAKIVADRADLPVIVVPTIASTDAPCSGCAVLYTEQGTFESVFYQKMNPQVVLVDTAVIAGAPVRFLVAGMGDALATWFEARSCSRTCSLNACGGLATRAGLHLARLCYETLLDYGPAAKIACRRQIVTPALDHIIEANILLSGLGLKAAGWGRPIPFTTASRRLPKPTSFTLARKSLRRAYRFASGGCRSGRDADRL